VAVLINKAMIEIPPKFAGKPPVNPTSRKDKNLFAREWKGAQGLAEDVRYYGQWMRDEAEKRIGHLYPKVEVTAEMAKVRPDLKPYVDQKLTVIAWLWARTVKSPNPAFAQVDVPLASTFMLCTKVGKEAYVEPVIEDGGYRFTVKVGQAEGCGGGEERDEAVACELRVSDVGRPDIRRLHQVRRQGRAHRRAADGHRRRG
jgi:putative DNA methylase